MAEAIVTGATSGIGLAIALALQGAGHQVLAIGRRTGELSKLQERGLQTLALDLADAKATTAALKGCAPDVLINNAGMIPALRSFCDMSDEDLDRTLDINVRAALTVTRALAPGMRERKKGHIFFTGSTAGHVPFANMAVYGASKAALGHFAQALRLELAPDNVRVTEIVAGRVETDLYKSVLPDAARAAMYANATAVQPSDVAAMVLAALALPPHASVSRLDIVPTRIAAPPANKDK